METTTIPVVPDHEMIRLIGSGSSGQVWLARNVLGSYRAVKIVQEKRFKHRVPFEHEFKGILKFEPVSRLHDGLVDILQVGRNEEAGYFYCVMELADNVVTGSRIDPATYAPRTLATDKERLKRLPVTECVRLGAALASALSFLHRNGLFHRDIKPSNIIFVGGTPKLADIGLVTDASEDRSFVGTEGFIAPEGSGTRAADIYALGKVLYETSTGKDRNEYPALPEFPGKSRGNPGLDSVEPHHSEGLPREGRAAFPHRRRHDARLAGFPVRQSRPAQAAQHGVADRVVAIIGTLVALGVVGSLIWRFIWLRHRG